MIVVFKADCLARDLGLWVKCPLWGSFQGILAHIYSSFRENHGKLRTARSSSATKEWAWHLPSTNFPAHPLMRPRTESLTSVPFPGFEPRTFRVAAGFPNDYTAWSDHEIKISIQILIPFLSIFTLFKYFEIVRNV